MKKICKVCGKEFEGRVNSTVCSGTCRIEYQKQYQLKYKQENKEYVKNYNQRWYAMHSNQPVSKKIPEEVLNNVVTLKAQKKPKTMPDNYKASSWGRKYWKADRLDKIVMLSSALSKWNLERLTYGQLSAIFESGRYMTLLYKVLRLEEGLKNEADAQIRKV